MTDELRERLAQVDPMHPGVPTRPVTAEASRDLLEKIMSTQTEDRPEPSVATRKTSRLAVAAVATLVVAVGGVIAFGNLAGNTLPGTAPLELTAGQEDIMASCIMFSPEELEHVAEIAFEGTVTAVEGSRVTLGVDRWFRGGDHAEVVLNAPQDMEALIGGIPFNLGDSYLISAQNGTVNYCGFSGPSTPEYRTAFEAAFSD